MKRKIVEIDQEKCSGCGICVDACHEGALQLIDGKARLVSDSYCDGLGDCLPECPTGAITLTEREAAAFDEEAVKKHMANMSANDLACGCPGVSSHLFVRQDRQTAPLNDTETKTEPSISQLRQWPCQLKLVPANAPYFQQADLLVAADCTAYAYANIHSDFMNDKITLIGCPKLDQIDYTGKLTEILQQHDLKSITILRMEVPCCSGIAHAAQQAIKNCGKKIPCRIIIIGTGGNIMSKQQINQEV